MEIAADMIPLVIFARVPVPGAVKTRLAAAMGSEMAGRIYRDLLNETARLVGETAHHVAFTGHERPLALSNIFHKARTFIPQTGDTLGDRMRNACEYWYARNAAGVIVIGCDCPWLTGAIIAHARDALERNTEVVIGPASDGGYYLIGCRQSAMAIFDAHGWGTPDLLRETLEIIRREKYRFTLLPTLSDVDDVDDFNEWQKRK